LCGVGGESVSGGGGPDEGSGWVVRVGRRGEGESAFMFHPVVGAAEAFGAAFAGGSAVLPGDPVVDVAEFGCGVAAGHPADPVARL
jgi:hypothetical protein